MAEKLYRREFHELCTSRRKLHTIFKSTRRNLSTASLRTFLYFTVKRNKSFKFPQIAQQGFVPISRVEQRALSRTDEKYFRKRKLPKPGNQAGPARGNCSSSRDDLFTVRNFLSLSRSGHVA